MNYLPGPIGDPRAWGLRGASDFADAELLPCDVPECSQGTSVLADSWGRIKASLRNPQTSH